ncbi:MAG TPA: PorT family protein, partial [Chitinophagaceae bacterium]|nr:PorT family protein [Chitinophagaceae bacterium]
MLHLLRTKTPLKVRASLVIITGCLLLQSVAGAQYVEQNQPDHDTKPYYFGITIGINLARFQTNLHPRFMQLDTVMVAEPTN